MKRLEWKKGICYITTFTFRSLILKIYQAWSLKFWYWSAVLEHGCTYVQSQAFLLGLSQSNWPLKIEGICLKIPGFPCREAVRPYDWKMFSFFFHNVFTHILNYKQTLPLGFKSIGWCVDIILKLGKGHGSPSILHPLKQVTLHKH